MPLSRTLKLHCSSTPTSVWMRRCGKSYINTVRLPFCCVMSSAKQVPNNFVVVQLKLANPNSLPVWATALSGHLVQLSWIVSHEATESTRVLSLASLQYFFSCVIVHRAKQDNSMARYKYSHDTLCDWTTKLWWNRKGCLRLLLNVGKPCQTISSRRHAPWCARILKLNWSWHF